MSLIWRRHQCQLRTANIDLFSAFMVIECWWFCTGPHLPWHRTSIYVACLAFAYILKSFSINIALKRFIVVFFYYLQFPGLLIGMTIPLRYVLAAVSQILHFILRSYLTLVFKFLPIVYIFHILLMLRRWRSPFERSPHKRKVGYSNPSQYRLKS